MVHLDRVAELIQQDVVDQVPGEGHQEKGEIDVLAAAATAPAAVHVFDGYPSVVKAMWQGERSQSEGQAAFGLVPQGGFEQAAQSLLGGFLLEAGLPRTGDQQFLSFQAQLKPGLFVAADPHLEGGESQLGVLVPDSPFGRALERRSQLLLARLNEPQKLLLAPRRRQVGEEGALPHDQPVVPQAIGVPHRDGTQFRNV